MGTPVMSAKILVAPLNWGLGHATRCIPVIKQLVDLNFTVVIAASGKIEALLKLDFPQLQFLSLPGYHINYSTTAWGLPFKVVAQIPKIISAVRMEQRWLQKVVALEHFDAIISDNRFGLYHHSVPCIFITHQLTIKAPFKWAELLLQKINYSFINRFAACWVPDVAGTENLAGGLSHPAKKPKVPLYYIGHLSRLQKGPDLPPRHLLFLLSGPEPQRTIFEKLVLKDLELYKEPVVMVRGLPAGADNISLGRNITVFNHLPTSLLQQKINTASFVISRCGYSTVMDLAVTHKKGILVATPGQTEQEYLAKHLSNNRFALCIAQKKFRLTTALELAKSFRYKAPQKTESHLPEAIHHLQQLIAKNRNIKKD